MAAGNYDSKSIEVLSGLDPVRKRPGMYTDTSTPNHLVQEVLDNSVDEALAGHCSTIKINLFKDGSIEVSDDGRGMPTDIHPEHQVSGVELILCKLHAGAKFSGEDYNFSGGLHGVGVSVVNALSKSLIVTVKRNAQELQMEFAGGEKTKDLVEIGTVGARNTGTKIFFVPDEQYFESTKLKIAALKHLLKAKAVLCPGLKIQFFDEQKGEKIEWEFENGLASYLAESEESDSFLLKESVHCSKLDKESGLDRSLYPTWSNAQILLKESYLILQIQLSKKPNHFQIPIQFSHLSVHQRTGS